MKKFLLGLLLALIPTIASAGFKTDNLQCDTITFEGATADTYETRIVPTDATADDTITLPDATGTVTLGTGTAGKSTKWITGNSVGDGTNTDTDVASAVSLKHTQNTDTQLFDGKAIVEGTGRVSFTDGIETDTIWNYIGDSKHIRWNAGESNFQFYDGTQYNNIIRTYGITPYGGLITIWYGNDSIKADTGFWIDTGAKILGAPKLIVGANWDSLIEPESGYLSFKSGGGDQYNNISARTFRLSDGATIDSPSMILESHPGMTTQHHFRFPSDMGIGGKALISGGEDGYTQWTNYSLTYDIGLLYQPLISDGVGGTHWGEVAFPGTLGYSGWALTSFGDGTTYWSQFTPYIANYSLLSEYTQTNTQIVDAVSKAHTQNTDTSTSGNFEINGNLLVDSSIGIGTSPTPTPLTIRKTSPDDSSFIGIDSIIYGYSTTGSDHQYYGIRSEVITDTIVDSDSAYGGIFSATNNDTASLISGIVLGATNSGNTDVSVATLITGSLNSGTIGTFGGYVCAPDTGWNTGTIGKTYGFYCNDITGGTQTDTPYSFYANDINAPSFFRGGVETDTMTATSSANAKFRYNPDTITWQLTTDGSTYSDIATGLAGSGTAGYLAKWTGATSIGDSTNTDTDIASAVSLKHATGSDTAPNEYFQQQTGANTLITLTDAVMTTYADAHATLTQVTFTAPRTGKYKVSYNGTYGAYALPTTLSDYQTYFVLTDSTNTNTSNVQSIGGQYPAPAANYFKIISPITVTGIFSCTANTSYTIKLRYMHKLYTGVDTIYLFNTSIGGSHEMFVEELTDSY